MSGQGYCFHNGAWELADTPPSQIPEEDTRFYKAISPLLVVFRIYAMELTPGQGHSRCLVALRVLYLAFQISGFVVLFSAFLSAANDVSSLSFLCTVVATSGVFFVTVLNLHIKRSRLVVLLQDLNALMANFSKARGLCRRLYWSTLIFMVFMSLSGLESLARYAVLKLTGTQLGETGDHGISSGVQLFIYLWVPFMLNAYAACICLFGVVLWSLNFALASLEAGNATSFLRLHGAASRLVQSADFCYREILTVWCVVELVVAVFAGRAANLNDPTDIRMSSLIALVFMTAFFLVKVLAASAVNSRVIESLKEISFVDDLTIQDLSPSSTALAVRIKLYIEHIQISTPAITGWGLVVISKVVVVAAVGNIITYILVLYDKK